MKNIVKKVFFSVTGLLFIPAYSNETIEMGEEEKLLYRVLNISGAFLDNTPFSYPNLGEQSVSSLFMFSFLPSIDVPEFSNATPGFHGIPLLNYETSYLVNNFIKLNARTSIGISIPGVEKIVGVEEKPNQWLLGTSLNLNKFIGQALIWSGIAFQYSKTTIEGIKKPVESTISSDTSLLTGSVGFLWKFSETSIFSFITPYSSFAMHLKNTQTSIDLGANGVFDITKVDTLSDSAFPVVMSGEVGGFLFNERMLFAFQELLVPNRLFMPRIIIGGRWLF